MSTGCVRIPDIFAAQLAIWIFANVQQHSGGASYWPFTKR